MDRTLTVSCGNGLSIVIYDFSVITEDCSPSVFNSYISTDEEIATLREIVGPDTPLSEPPRHIYAFQHFATLFQYSQSLEGDKGNVCTATLPLWIAKEILSVQESYFTTGNINKNVTKKIEDAVLSSEPLANLVAMIQTGKKWFLRMDDCSPKDSEEQKLPITSLSELVVCLCTSTRAGGDFEAHILDNKPINLFLLRWNPEMSEHVEFRCFVPPWTDNGPARVTAISQYHWQMPFPTSRFCPREVVDDAVAFSTLCMLREILAVAAEKDIIDGLKYWGFSFDIVIQGPGQADLIEINPFGARGGCGSCLFHWERDGKLLYGGNKGIEVRLVTN